MAQPARLIVGHLTGLPRIGHVEDPQPRDAILTLFADDIRVIARDGDVPRLSSDGDATNAPGSGEVGYIDDLKPGVTVGDVGVVSRRGNSPGDVRCVIDSDSLGFGRVGDIQNLKTFEVASQIGDDPPEISISAARRILVLASRR